MLNKWIQRILFFVLLIFLQSCILNKIHLFGFMTPLLYVYFILKLSSETSRNELLLWSFFLGFFIDIFQYSMGLNMIACTFIGFFRYYILRIHSSREALDSFLPSVQTMGTSLFLRYAIVMILLHHTILFSVEVGSFHEVGMLFLKIIGSATLTFILVIGCESFNIKKL